jgi:O-antigen ligase
MSPTILPRSALTVGFPILIAVAYTNISDVLLRELGIPSLLQATVAVLVVVVLLAHEELRPLEVALHPVTLLMAVYCAVLFVSSAWADDLLWADFRISEAVKGLVIMILGASLMSTLPRLRAALATLAIVAASLAAVSVVQIATHSTRDFAGLLQVQSGNIYEDVSQPRAAGPLSDPNFYGQILLMTLPIAAALAVTSPRKRIVFTGAALAIFAGVLVTYSRGAMLSVLAMLLLVPFFVPIRRGLVLKAALAAIVLMAVTPSTVVKRFDTVTDVVSKDSGGQPETSRDASVDKRKLLAAVGLRMFEDAPFFGVGAGNFGKHYARYADEIGSPAPQYDDPGDRQFPHSLYIELASENGLLGLGCFAAAMVAAFVSLAPSRQKSFITASIAIALGGYLVSSLFLHSAYQRYLWLLLAFVPAIDRLRRKEVIA